MDAPQCTDLVTTTAMVKSCSYISISPSHSISKNLTEEFGCIVTWLPVDLAVDKVCNFGDDFEKAKDVAGKYDYLARKCDE